MVNDFLKRLLTAFIILWSGFAYGQSDTTKPAQQQTNSWPSNKGIFISGGIGESIISDEVYGILADGGFPGYGTSQSPVAIAHIDYTLGKHIDIGLGIAYQTLTGVPFENGENNTNSSNYYTEHLSRLNIAPRVLFYSDISSHVEFYTALAVGLSAWTDIITPQPPAYPFDPITLTMGASYFQRISLQVAPIGIRVMWGHIGFNAELAIGTPYFAEGSFVYRIGKLKG